MSCIISLIFGSGTYILHFVTHAINSSAQSLALDVVTLLLFTVCLISLYIISEIISMLQGFGFLWNIYTYCMYIVMQINSSCKLHSTWILKIVNLLFYKIDSI